MRLVLDTNVLIAALRSPSGASTELIRRIGAGRYKPLASVPLFLEYEAVATRPEHLEAAGLSRAEVVNVLDVLAGCIEAVEIHYLWRPRLRDLADDMVLEAAVNGQADAIVTFNGRDFGREPASFGIALRMPGDILRA